MSPAAQQRPHLGLHYLAHRVQGCATTSVAAYHCAGISLGQDACGRQAGQGLLADFANQYISLSYSKPK